MPEPVQLQEVFDAADNFLRPVIDRGMHYKNLHEIRNNRGGSLVEILSQKLPTSPKNDETQARLSIIEKALQYLQDIHKAFVLSANSKTLIENSSDDPREDARRRRTLNTLLDLISIEGVYPSLSTGVGIPLEKRVITNLPPGVIPKHVPEIATDKSQNEALLRRILSTLINIVLDDRDGIQSIVRGRVLSDIISGVAELAFNTCDVSDQGTNKLQQDFDRIIAESPTSAILPILSNFLQPEAASWFKSIISARISQIPLREDGVIHTIWFLASQFAPTLGEGVTEQSSGGPPITVQAIMQISKLLSSVPQGMDPTSYFQNLAPKLLTLIDCDDPDLKRTAAYVVGSGILGKRAYGAPGTIGHSIFIVPLFKAITAKIDDDARKWLRSFNPSAQNAEHGDIEHSLTEVLVEDSTLLLAIERLCTITLQHPNPGLVKRLVQPILLPLWGLACHAQAQNTGYDKPWSLLQTYFSLSAGLVPFQRLADNLLYDGGDDWIFQNSLGGISLVKRTKSEFNLIQLMDQLDHRAEKFTKLMNIDPQSEDRTGDIFLYVSQKWLLEPPDNSVTLQINPAAGSNIYSHTIMAKLVSAKIAEKLLDEFKDNISRHPLRVLELAQQLIQSELTTANDAERRRTLRESGKASLESLANIANPTIGESVSEDEQKSSTEILSATFSLLSTILASPEFSMSRSILPTLESIKSQLDRLLPSLPKLLLSPGQTASMLLEIQINSPHDTQVTASTSSHVTDLDTHRQALRNMTSSLLPVQAEGMSLLSKLIKKSSPVLDIPSTLTLLLSIITDQGSETSGGEDFIYLNAIKLMGILASNHPRTVVKSLVERYADRNEEWTLDQRLRVGESLIRTVEDLGEALTGETAQIIGDGMINVASRRGYKPKTHKARKRQIEETRRAEERRAKENEIRLPPGWTVSSPALSNPEPESIPLDDEDSDAETPEQAAQSANLLAAWAAGSQTDLEPDDIRIRASSISILASAIQTNIVGLGVSLATSAVDLAMSTLTIESSPESAILRRASAVLLLDIIKAIDSERESGSKRLGFGFSLTLEDLENTGSSRSLETIGSIPKILNSLSIVESRETDSIVREHIRVLVESLEAWMEKSLLWGIRAQSTGEDLSGEPRLQLGEHIAGLHLDPLARRDSQNRPRIEEIE
ncbi:protein required for cell viability [Talaromyces proteolyticus]|uniref:Protein required for cell viability n=1 Tax=Talaromyces proteolyticus TaxID=1131652 RepID=A0AAD4KMU0_9EURO|nr:protein required for cell viability [Talaromyces proteolyticus]KAH8696342.1 protein required for cell viability [Talaromyces proteolyticus]